LLLLLTMWLCSVFPSMQESYSTVNSLICSCSSLHLTSSCFQRQHAGGEVMDILQRHILLLNNQSFELSGDLLNPPQISDRSGCVPVI
jgi:hypothetical protein